MNKENYRPVRPKKVVLFPEIGRAKIFLSPTRPHKSKVYENIYIYFFISKKTQTKKIHQQICSYECTFFSSKQKKGLFVFQQRKVLLEQLFNFKLCLENSTKSIKKIFCGCLGEDFFRYPHFRTQKFFFLALVFRPICARYLKKYFTISLMIL